MSAIPMSDDEYRTFATLASDEARWSEREELFKLHGYNFRPRLRKGWTPSWLTTGKSPLHSEDGEMLRTHLVDAYTDDGQLVLIKRMKRNDEETRIAQMLSAAELREDPRNHCVHVIEVIDDPDDGSISYMVMPLLRNADDPPFQYVKEIVDFVDQILEGLVFLHEKGVAHRDCVLHNFLMDPGLKMYPEGFHPVQVSYKRDYSGIAEYHPRSLVGVKYFFADFGISVHIPDTDRPRLVTGEFGRDRDPPELSPTIPYDPFKLDIFIIGNMFRQEFCDKFSNLEFLRPLANRMTIQVPEQRPSAEDALGHWRRLREGIYTVNKEWRARPRGDPVLGIVLDALSICDISMHYTRAFFEGLFGPQSHRPL